MHSELEVLLDYRDSRWNGRGRGLTVSTRTLGELEREIGRRLTDGGRFAPGSTVTVMLRCTPQIIPEWMRPYHSHYFNQALSVKIGSDGSPGG